MDRKPSIFESAQKKFHNIAAIVNVFTLRIVWVDDTFAQTLGYTPEEMIDMPAVQITDLQTGDALKEATRLFTTHGKESKPVITKSGETLHIKTKVHAFLYEKEPHIVVTDTEFTEKQQIFR